MVDWLNGNKGFVCADHMAQCRGNPCGCPRIDRYDIVVRRPHNRSIIGQHDIMGRHDSMGRHKACPYDVIIVDDHGIVAQQGLAAF